MLHTVDDASGIPVCEMLWLTDERSEDVTKANAYLVAAAPEMAVWIKAAVPMLEEYLEYLEISGADDDAPVITKIEALLEAANDKA